MPKSKRKSAEPTEKERFEILLEEIRSEVKQLAEGQDQFREEVKRSFQELQKEVSALRQKIERFEEHLKTQHAV